MGEEDRRPWLVAATLMLLSAGAAAAATTLHWQPCRGSMLDGTAWGPPPGFPDACLARMDGGIPFTYPAEPAEVVVGATELGALAVVLAGLAWLPLLVSAFRRPWTRVLALGPVAVSLVVAGQSLAALGRPDRDPADTGSTWLWVGIELAALVAVVAVVRGEAPRGRVRLLVLAWGASAFGLVHQILDYRVMGGWSSANWDTPPGTGYGTALLLVAAAVAAVVLTWRPDLPSRVVAALERHLVREHGDTSRPSPQEVTR